MYFLSFERLEVDARKEQIRRKSLEASRANPFTSVFF